MSTPLQQLSEGANFAPSGSRSIRDIVADLSKPIAARHIKTRKQGSQVLSYIEWFVAAQYLDHFAPGWSWEIVSIAEHAKFIVVHGELSVPCLEGVVVRHATGVEQLDAQTYGDSVSKASAMSFKRACALFGLGRHLYNKKGQDEL